MNDLCSEGNLRVWVEHGTMWSFTMVMAQIDGTFKNTTLKVAMGSNQCWPSLEAFTWASPMTLLVKLEEKPALY
jgi:hypothetical protein